MNCIKKIMNFAKSLVAVIIISISLFSPAAIAAMGMPAVDNILKSVPITGGKFSVDLTVTIPSKARIGKAVVSLPQGETGTIDEIAITGMDGKIFGCKNIKIQNGTDLIKACGGPAYLIPGSTVYQAKGSNFKPKADVQLGVELSP